MMQSYIDKKYFVHFFEKLLATGRFSEEANEREKMLDFFKNNTDLILDSDFSEVINGINSPIQKGIAQTLITQLTLERNDTVIKTNEKGKFYKLKKLDIYNTIKQPFASFWLGDSYNHHSEKYAVKNPYYFFTKENDLNKWQSFSKSGDYYIASNVNRGKEDVFDWSKMNNFKHRFNDILISDHYSFQSKIGIQENIIKLIKGLLAKGYSIKNILIFTGKNNIYNNSLEDTYNLIKENLINSDIQPNIKIFSYSGTPHGRYALTNNFFMDFGNSIDVFNQNKKLRSQEKLNDSSITIMPVFKTNKSKIESILKWARSIKNKERGFTCAGDYGDDIGTSILDFFD